MVDPNLTARAHALEQSVSTLSSAVRDLTTSQQRVKLAIRLTAVGLVAAFILAAVCTTLLIAHTRVQDRLSEQSQRIEQVQQRTSNEVLCPLYSLLIEFEPRTTRIPGLSDEERAQRLATYEVIHRGFDALRCQ